MEFTAANIALCGVFVVLGWFWSYLFLRQLIFNFSVAFPMIKKMKAADNELIADTAKKYTFVSVFANLLVCIVIAVLCLIFLKKSYLKICFAVGAVIALAFSISSLSYRTKRMFESFCTSYYRFVPDDELRTAMYNKKTGQIKSRLHELGIKEEIVPEFKN